MEGLIGTQHPGQRITTAAASLELLEQALPGLTTSRRRRRAAIDWARVERGMRTCLPADYRLLAEWYPSFVFSHEFMRVGLPAPGSEGDNAGVAAALEILQDWWEDDMSLGLPPYPSSGGLLPWTDSAQGDLFMWMTRAESPDDWPVTVATTSGDWWLYTGGAVQFLAELAFGSLEPWSLVDVHTDVNVLAD